MSMLPIHSCFASIDIEHFLEGTQLAAAPKKVNNPFLKTDFHTDLCCFSEEIVCTILSTVAARSLIKQERNWFCWEIFHWEPAGDKYSGFHLFGQLLDGHLGLGWFRISEVEAAKSEFHSVVPEKGQVEKSTSRPRVSNSDMFTISRANLVFAPAAISSELVYTFGVVHIFSDFCTSSSGSSDHPVDSVCGQVISGSSCHICSLP